MKNKAVPTVKYKMEMSEENLLQLKPLNVIKDNIIAA